MQLKAGVEGEPLQYRFRVRLPDGREYVSGVAEAVEPEPAEADATAGGDEPKPEAAEPPTEGEG